MNAAAPARRVRMLRLAAADAGAANRGAFLIEDALRTASLPGGDGGRLLLIRRLALGHIRPGQSAASVALAIEQGVWRLGGTLIHGADPAAVDSSVVYFRDRAEAATELALRLAQGRDTGAWFWPLAVPGWQPAASVADGLRAALRATLAAAPGPAAVVALAGTLHQRGHLSALLAVLQPDDGPALLAACGWSPAEPAPASARVEHVSSQHWRPLLAHWLAVWGVTDPRSLWLAAIAVACQRPDAIADPALPAQAARLAQAFAPSVNRPGLASLARPLSASAPSEAFNEPADDAGVSHVSPREVLKAARRGRPNTSPAATLARLDGPPAGADRPRAEAFPAPSEAAVSQPAQVESWLAGAVTTPWAGLYLLLPLLERLDMGEMLAAQPHLAAAGLPGRVLFAVARRLRIPVDDAALSPLPRPRLWRAPGPFAVPASWFEGWAVSQLSLRRMTGRPGVRVLSADGLPLALWRGRAPEVVRARLSAVDSDATARLARRPALSPRSDLAFLVDAWVRALCRWLAGYTTLTLRDLVGRAGLVAATRTHLDVYFEHAQADVRIRRAGLDLDPGWLPWFGRVVAYHYG